MALTPEQVAHHLYYAALTVGHAGGPAPDGIPGYLPSPAGGIVLRERLAARLVAIAGYAGSPCPGESHGDPRASNSSAAGGGWGPAYGLWQIRTRPDAPERTKRNLAWLRAEGSPESVAIQRNAAAALAIWKEQGRAAWAVTGSCETQNLTAAVRAAVAAARDDPAGAGAATGEAVEIDPLAALTDPLEAIGALVAALLDASTWRRAGLIAAGAGLVGFGATLARRGW